MNIYDLTIASGNYSNEQHSLLAEDLDDALEQTRTLVAIREAGEKKADRRPTDSITLRLHRVVTHA